MFGLAASPSVVDVRLATVGLIAIGCLVALTSASRRGRIAIFLFFIAFGLKTAEQRVSPKVTSTERFVTVSAPIGRGWERTAHHTRLEAEWFEIDGARIREPIAIYVTAKPPPIQNEHRIIADGFLARPEGERYRLSVKSARLIAYDGSVGIANPIRWNRTISRRLHTLSAKAPRGIALVEALALGRSDQLPHDIRESYRRGGTYHLLVFSGMQIAIAAGFFVACFRMLGMPRLGDCALLALSVVAPPFAGNEPSVSRASWMIGLYALSRILHRPTSVENLLFVSALLRLMTHPQELADPGFALTYAATGGLILIGKPLASLIAAKQKVLRDVAYGAGAELATTPFTLFFFHQYVIGSSLVTVVLAPLLLAMLALSFFAALACFISMRLVLIALHAVTFLDRIAVEINHLVAGPLHLSGLASAPPASLVIAAAVVTLVLHAMHARRSVGLSVMAILLVLPLAATLRSRLVPTSADGATVDILDVGHGDAILVRDRHSSILFDGGGRSSNPSFGRSVLVPLLLDRGVTHLDAIALTHPDADHCDGLAAVLENLPVDQFWISSRHFDHECAQRLLDLAARNATWIRLSNYRESMRAGAIRVEPISARLRFKRSKLNNSSVVFRVDLAGRRILITGDIEKEAERLLVDEHADKLGADVLKISHHGSRNSSTDAFLGAVSPRIALISCGRRNPFGHPHERVLDALSERSIRVWRTDRHGSIRLEVDRTLWVHPEH